MIDKEALEKMKLEAEIDEIKLKVEALKQTKESNEKILSKSNLSSWAAIIIALITIITGALTIGDKFNIYLAQNERDRKINVDTAMIQIVNKLNTGNAIEDKNNTMLLSAYGMQAVPILLDNLESSDTPEATAIIESLKQIKKNVDTEEFLKLVKDRANAIFENNLKMLPTVNEDISKEQEAAEKKITFFIWALRKLFEESEIRTIFNDWQNKVELRQPAVLEDNKQGLLIKLRTSPPKSVPHRELDLW